MNISRSALISLSRQRWLQDSAERSYLARRISRRFVAGTSVSEALDVARRLNKIGISVTFDALGENIRTESEAHFAAQIYHEILDKMASQGGYDANVSVKLTQMGMDLGADVATRIVGGIVEHAHRTNTFVRVDMEDSSYTQATLDLVRDLHSHPVTGQSVGVVVQAYLHRTEEDVNTLLRNGIRMRLCKGAYLESPQVSFAAKSDTDSNYIALAQRMMISGIFHGFATHDETMINAIREFSNTNDIDRRSFEFQMLYGIRRDLQESLVKDGYRVRVYVPFGTEWYPYFMRRLAERPANLFFMLKNLLR